MNETQHNVHTFWKDLNPHNCSVCGKTEEELLSCKHNWVISKIMPVYQPATKTALNEEIAYVCCTFCGEVKKKKINS